MNPTLKVIELVDKLKLQKYFIEKGNKVHFTPFAINSKKLEHAIEKVFHSNGKAYKKDSIEESILRDLDF